MPEQKISADSASSGPSEGLYDRIDELLAEIDQACDDFEIDDAEPFALELPDLATLTARAAADDSDSDQSPVRDASPDSEEADLPIGMDEADKDHPEADAVGQQLSASTDLDLLNAVNAELNSLRPSMQPPDSAASQDHDMMPQGGADLDDVVAELAKPKQSAQTPKPPQPVAPTQEATRQPPSAAVTAQKPELAGDTTHDVGEELSAVDAPAVRTAPSPQRARATPRRAWPVLVYGFAAGLLAPLATRLSAQPRVVRDTIGWVGVATLFYAICLWSYALLFRSGSKPASDAQGISIIENGSPASAGSVPSAPR